MKGYVFGACAILLPVILLYILGATLGWLFSGFLIVAIGLYLGITAKPGLKEGIFLAGSSLAIFLIFEALLGLLNLELPAWVIISQIKPLDALMYIIGGLIATVIYPYVKK